MFLDRYLIFISSVFYMLIAISCDYLFNSKKLRYALSTIVCVLFIFSTQPNISNKRNVKETIEKVNEFNDFFFGKI